mmetsp:Transcript_102486/g.288313  ORF Transcript_102486/g.288313 Transcript_102486/m.288313 type:complete len:194 (-) Transcript_102486:210-791(-)
MARARFGGKAVWPRRRIGLVVLPLVVVVALSLGAVSVMDAFIATGRRIVGSSIRGTVRLAAEEGKAAAPAVEVSGAVARDGVEKVIPLDLKEVAEEVPKEGSGGKRLRQFLALEPLDEDDQSDQWAADMKAENLSDDEQRKKFVAILSGILSAILGVGYLLATFYVDSRDVLGDSGLSQSDLAAMQVLSGGIR